MKVIAVSGTPGTGKTTIAKKLAKKLNYYYVDVNNLISKYKLSEGYDKKRRTKIVDVKKLNKKLIDIIDFFKNKNYIGMRPMSSARSTTRITKENIKKNVYIKKIKGIVIDSHLSHYLPRKYVDFCIVTKCGINELNKRLKKKKFRKDKIKENLQAEIFNVCYNEALEKKHRVFVVDTTKGFNISSIVNKLGTPVELA